eukprot:5185037-Pleurochrysis_carterae.AAC.1
MAGIDPNHLAHQQPYVMKGLPDFNLNHQITDSLWSPRFRFSGYRARRTMRFWLLRNSGDARARGSRRFHARLNARTTRDVSCSDLLV